MTGSLVLTPNKHQDGKRNTCCTLSSQLPICSTDRDTRECNVVKTSGCERKRSFSEPILKQSFQIIVVVVCLFFKYLKQNKTRHT